MRYAPDEWTRVGGRERQFYATELELETWLGTALPGNFAPYLLVGEDRLWAPGRKTTVGRVFRYALSDYRKCISEQPPGDADARTILWVCSPTLTPGIDGLQTEFAEEWFSLNGLVLVDRGRPRKGRKDSARISVVDKIRHKTTGALVQHKEYLRIYTTLEKAIRTQLCYSSVHTLRNGQRSEDSELRLMTRGAVEECRQGVPYTAEPGRLLQEPS